MKTIAFVPIKMESKRLPGKNLLPLKGKPLCFHIFATLLKSKYIDQVYVYCSDEAITNHIPKDVVFLKRPSHLDGDKIKGMEIYQSFIDEVDADVYVLAHATSPFLSVESLDNALLKVVKEEYDSAFSAKKIQTFCWYDDKPLNYKLDDIPRTQDIKPVLVETSGFYIFNKKTIKKNRRIGNNYWIQIVDDAEAIDIDEKNDYESALRIE